MTVSLLGVEAVRYTSLIKLYSVRVEQENGKGDKKRLRMWGWREFDVSATMAKTR